MESNGSSVELKPFGHQIAGHKSILRVDDTTICKLFTVKEHFVYSRCPEALRPFLPTFRGSLSVYCSRNSDGKVSFWRKTMESTDVSKETNSDDHRTQETLYNGSQDNIVTDVPFMEVAHGNVDVVKSNNGHPEIPTGDISWSLSCVQREMSLGRLKTDNSSEKYIMLENLVTAFSIPCMVDIKMGTRQHGDDVTDIKRNYQMSKCRNTTSCSLGLRYCGMQKYDATSRSFVRHDKYFGRKLTTENFSKTIYQFFHNEIHLQKDAIAAILFRLNNMCDVVKSLLGWRFYGCSILVIYEGLEEPNSSLGSQADALSSSKDTPVDHSNVAESRDVANQHESVKVDVRLIDFAQTSCPRDGALSQNGPDEGFLFGLENLKTILKDILQEIA